MVGFPRAFSMRSFALNAAISLPAFLDFLLSNAPFQPLTNDQSPTIFIDRNSTMSVARAVTFSCDDATTFDSPGYPTRSFLRSSLRFFLLLDTFSGIRSLAWIIFTMLCIKCGIQFCGAEYLSSYKFIMLSKNAPLNVQNDPSRQ